MFSLMKNNEAFFFFFLSSASCILENKKKIRVLPAGVEPISFHLLVQMLYILMGAKAIKLSMPVSLTEKKYIKQ